MQMIDKNIGCSVTMVSRKGAFIDSTFNGFRSVSQVRDYVRHHLRNSGHKIVHVTISQDGGYFKELSLRIW